VKEKIGLIGLGLVGSALTERFTSAGFEVVGYDIDRSRFEFLNNFNIEPANSPVEVAENCQRIVLSLPDSDVVKDVVQGSKGIVNGAISGTVIIDTTTGDPVSTVELSERLHCREIDYIDSTIVGSSEQVRSGEVILLIGGEKDIVIQQEDIFDSFASDYFLMGPNGKGAEAKLVVNLVIGLNRLVLSEGLALGIHAGIEPELLLKVLKSSAAYSKVMDIKGEKMLKLDFTPQARLKQHLKDVGLILDMGKRVKSPLPLSSIHSELLNKAVEKGHGDEDNSAIINVFLDNADGLVL